MFLQKDSLSFTLSVYQKSVQPSMQANYWNCIKDLRSMKLGDCATQFRKPALKHGTVFFQVAGYRTQRRGRSSRVGQGGDQMRLDRCFISLPSLPVGGTLK
jgi:hypothetical protein